MQKHLGLRSISQHHTAQATSQSSLSTFSCRGREPNLLTVQLRMSGGIPIGSCPTIGRQASGCYAQDHWPSLPTLPMARAVTDVEQLWHWPYTTHLVHYSPLMDDACVGLHQGHSSDRTEQQGSYRDNIDLARAGGCRQHSGISRTERRVTLGTVSGPP